LSDPRTSTSAPLSPVTAALSPAPAARFPSVSVAESGDPAGESASSSSSSLHSSTPISPSALTAAMPSAAPAFSTNVSLSNAPDECAAASAVPALTPMGRLERMLSRCLYGSNPHVFGCACLVCVSFCMCNSLFVSACPCNNKNIPTATRVRRCDVFLFRARQRVLVYRRSTSHAVKNRRAVFLPGSRTYVWPQRAVQRGAKYRERSPNGTRLECSVPAIVGVCCCVCVCCCCV
jgi:hypothetical protein